MPDLTWSAKVLAVGFALLACTVGLPSVVAVGRAADPSPAGAAGALVSSRTGPERAAAGCAEPYAADTFSRSVPPGDTWGSPETGPTLWETSFGASKLGLWSVANGVGKFQTTRAASSGQRLRAARDVDIRVRFAYSALARNGSLSTGLFARYRSLGGPAGAYVRMRVRHDGRHRFRVSLARIWEGVTTHTRQVDVGPAKARRWYWMRFQVVGDTMRGKLWSVRIAEPRWQVAMRHPSMGEMSETDAGIRNTYATSAALPLVLFDELSVTAPTQTRCGPTP